MNDLFQFHAPFDLDLPPTPSVYVDMGFNNNSPVMLTTVTSGATFSRSFSVKVTQILCTSLNRG